MACNSIALNGISGHCSVATGGIKAVYIAQYEDVSTLTYDASNNNISGITMDTGKKFVKFTFRKQSSNFNSEATIDDTTGARYWTNNAELVFAKAEAYKRLDIVALMADDCAVIVQDQMDQYMYMGANNPVTCTAGGQQTGTAFGDQNAYTVTLSDMSNEPVHFVDASVMSSGIIQE